MCVRKNEIRTSKSRGLFCALCVMVCAKEIRSKSIYIL